MPFDIKLNQIINYDKKASRWPGTPFLENNDKAASQDKKVLKFSDLAYPELAID